MGFKFSYEFVSCSVGSEGAIERAQLGRQEVAMALLDRGLWQAPKTSLASLSLSKARGLPRASPARVSMGMGLKHPHSPNDPFLSKLAAAASTELGKAQLAGASGVSDGPPLLDVLNNPVMMAAPAQVS